MYISEKYRDLLGVVAHDLKNYIGCIEGYARLLAVAANEEDPNHKRYSKILRRVMRAQAR